MTTAVRAARPVEDDSRGEFRPIPLRPAEPIAGTANAASSASANLAAAVPQARSTESHRTGALQGVIWTADERKSVLRSEPKQKATATPDAVKGAKGVVMHVGEQSVQCEFLQGPQPAIVWLPRSLFPSDASIGFSFLLTVDRSNGYLGPKIIERQSEPDPEIVSSVARMLDEFES